MNFLILASAVFIILHNVDGDEVMVNVDQIVMLKHTKESQGQGPNVLLAPGHKCAIGLSNGKFVSVTEDCGMVRQAIREAEGIMK